MAAVKRASQLLGIPEQALDSRDGTTFSLRHPQDSVSVQEECNLGSGEHYYLSSSVNKLSISKSIKTLFHTASRDLDSAVLPGCTL